jgi:hypothetical protein
VVVERIPGATSLIDVLDRVLDKGIGFDPWVRAGIVAVSAVEAQFVVASIDTYLRYSEAVGASTAAAHPTFGSHASSESARPKSDDDDDDDNGGGGSSGAPVMVFVEREPRRFPTPRPRRTRH